MIKEIQIKLWVVVALMLFSMIEGQGATKRWIPNISTAGGTPTTNYNDLIFNPLGSTATTTGASSYSTGASYQPAPNALVLAYVLTSKATAPDVPSFSGNGLTWTLVSSNNFVPAGENITVFRGQSNAPTSGTGTATFAASQTGCIIQVVEYQGADATGANGANAIVQVVTNGATSTSPQTGTYTVSTMPGTNAFIWAYGDGSNSATNSVPGTNYAEYVRSVYSTPSTGFNLEYQMTATTNTSHISASASKTWGGILLEVKPGIDASASTIPTLVQARSWWSPDELGNNFTNWLPNATLSGNLIHMHFVHDYGPSITNIVEDKSDISTKAQKATYVSDGYTVEDWYITNCTAGAQKFIFQLDTNCLTFHMEMVEMAHVALYQPVDATNSITPTPPTFFSNRSLVDTGSITTTTDGDLIMVHSTDGTGGTLEPGLQLTDPVHAGGHWIGIQSWLAAASSYAVQSKAGGLDMFHFFNQTSGTGEHYFDSIVAYKRGSGGTLPSTSAMRIVRIIDDFLDSGTTKTHSFPMDGNLAVIVNTYVKSDGHMTNIVAYPSATWTEIVTTNVDAPQMWYSAAAGKNSPPNLLTIAISGSNFSLSEFCDIANANASPFDLQNETSGAATPNQLVTGAATITPTTANGLVINTVAYFNGPEQGSLNQAHIFDTPTYNGNTDGSHLSHGDTLQHYFNPNTSAITFGQTNGPNSGGWQALAVAFKSK